MTKPDRFLFVSGCARSGTTVMATLLNWNDTVLVTQERFAPLLRLQPDDFLPELFTAERMLDFRLRECGYSDFAAQREHSAHYANPKDFSAIDAYPVRGDKITHLYSAVDKFEEPAWAESDIILLHMIRGLDDVVCSYETRRLNAADAWELGYETAISDWSASVEQMFRYTKTHGPHMKVGIVEYENIFTGGLQGVSDAVARIYAFAGLAFGDKQAEGVAMIHKASAFFERNRIFHADAVAEARRRITGETMRKYEQLRELGL